MQLVGRTCSITGEKIQIASKGIGCRLCDAVFLRDAVAGTQCPKCSQDMMAQEAQELLDRKREVATLHAMGGSRFVFVGITELAIFFYSLAGLVALFHQGTNVPASPSIGGMVVWVAARGGNKVARLLLRLSVLVNAVVLALAGLKSLEVHNYGGATFLIPIAVMNFVALWLLFTPSLNAYLDDQRYAGQD